MDKTVLITGASKGIGLCCAKGLKARGYRVFGTARQADGLAVLQANGIEALPLDLDDSKAIKQLISTVLDKTNGKLAAVVNNAGYGQPGAIEDLSGDLIRNQFDTQCFWSHRVN